MNLRSCSLCPDYCHPFTSSKVGELAALKLNAKEPYLSAEREIRFCRHLFTFSLKCKIMQFHVEIVQKRQRNIQKSVMRVQSCHFPSKPIVVVVVVVAFFFTFSLRSSRRIVKSLPVRKTRHRWKTRFGWSSRLWCDFSHLLETFLSWALFCVSWKSSYLWKRLMRCIKFHHRFSIQQCMDIFGPQFNAANIQRGIDQTNTNYGGYGISSSKVILVKI